MKKIIILYVLSGVGGNLVSALLTPYPSVGASTCIFGLLGCIIGYLFLNWTALDYPGSPRNRMMCFMCVMIFFNLIMGFSGEKEGIDNWGHVGGLITGIACGIVLLPRMNTGAEANV